MLEVWMLVKLCTQNSTSAARRRKSTFFAKLWTVVLWFFLQFLGAFVAVQLIPQGMNPQLRLVGIWAAGFALAIIVSFVRARLLTRKAGA